jgi:hypothetical protein
MLYREIIAVCSQIHTKHINTLYGQNVELLNVKLAVPLGCKGIFLKAGMAGVERFLVCRVQQSVRMLLS